MGRSRTEVGDLSLLLVEPADERELGLKIDRLESFDSRRLDRGLFVAMFSCRGDKGGWNWY